MKPNILSQTQRAWIVITAIGLATVNGCMDVDSVTEGMAPPTPANTSTGTISTNLEGFLGCLSAVAQDSSRIKITFEFPPTASLITISRDGNPIASFDPSYTKNYFIDGGLAQGQTYHYTCDGMFSGVSHRGANRLDATTQLFDPPVFMGINTNKPAPIILDPHSVQISWKAAVGVMVDHYEVYKKVGTSLDMDASLPIKNVPIGPNSTIFNGLGDQMSYTFGVRACATTDSSLCDDNTITATVTMPDDGPPTTPGVTDIGIANTQVSLTVPWTDANGAIQSRLVYMSSTGAPSDFAHPFMTVNVPDKTNPPNPILIPGLVQGNTYYFIVRDVDSLGQSSTNTSVASKYISDITAPYFSGLTGVALGSPKDSVIKATWSAITSQPTDINGASRYILYYAQASYPAVAVADACTDGAVVPSSMIDPADLAKLDAANDTPGQPVTVSIIGLDPRTAYSICVQAQDAAGNTSATDNPLTLVTHDLTPPPFSGIQSLLFDQTLLQVNAGWNASSAADLDKYVLLLWKDNSDNPQAPSYGNVTVIPITATSGANVTSYSFNNKSGNTYPYTDGDHVFAAMVACDNAQIIPGGSQNCFPFNPFSPDTFDAAKAFAVSKELTIPNITPPGGFGGITSAVSNSEGTATVTWNAPSTAEADGRWPRYAGFLVYRVDTSANTLMTPPIVNCPCAQDDCQDHITSCTASNLDPYRTYTLYVAAYNPGMKSTALLPGTTVDEYHLPTSASLQVRTLDLTPPALGAVALTAPGVTGTVVSWSKASDNQYTGEGAVVRYEVYRTTDAPFSPLTKTFIYPTVISLKDSADKAATLVGAVGADVTQLTDPITADQTNQGKSYYWAVCAIDAQGNATCNANPTPQSIVDTVAPTVPPAPVFTSTFTAPPSRRHWSLSWVMSDNVTTSPNLRALIRVRQSTEDPGVSCPLPTDTVAWQGLGSELVAGADNLFTLPTDNAMAAPHLQGVVGKNYWYSYSLVVFDARGNQSTPVCTKVYSKLEPPTNPTELKWTPSDKVNGTQPVSASWIPSTDPTAVTGGQQKIRFFSGTDCPAATPLTDPLALESMSTNAQEFAPAVGQYSFQIMTIDAYGNENFACSPVLSVNNTKATVTKVHGTPKNAGDLTLPYSTGDVIPIFVTLSKPGITVKAGTPTLELALGQASPGVAEFVSATSESTTTVLKFQYTVANGDGADPLDYAATTSFKLTGVTIEDPYGNTIIPTLAVPGTHGTTTAPGTVGQAGSLSANSTIRINTSKPGISITAPANRKPATNYLNLANIDTTQISGTCSGVPDGTPVSIKVGMFNYTGAPVTCTGNVWTTTDFPAYVRDTLMQGQSYDVTATIVNTASIPNSDVIKITKDTEKPTAPSPLTMKTPSTTTGKSNTPIITASGVIVNQKVELYLADGENHCATPAGMADVTAGTATDITVSPALPSDGSYTFYAKTKSVSGNSSDCSEAFITYTLDTANLNVTVNQKMVQADPTRSLPVQFDVVFNKAVKESTFTLADIVQNGTIPSAKITWTITDSGDHKNFLLQATAIADNAIGTLVPSIAADTVEDLAANGNTVSTSSDNSVAYDNQPVAVTVNRATGQNATTKTVPISFTVVFSKAIDTGTFSVEDIIQGGTIASDAITWSITDSGDHKTFTLKATAITEGANGTLVPSIAANTLKDAAGNDNTASTSTANSVTYDNMPIDVTVNKAATQADPTATLPIVYDVVFSKEINPDTFQPNASTISQGGTIAAANITWTITDSGDHKNFTLKATAISGGSIIGTVIPSIVAGQVQDVAGNINRVSTSTNNSVTYDKAPVTVSINQAPGQPDPINATPISFTAVFSKAIDVTSFVPSDIKQNGTLTSTALSWSIADSGDNRTFTISVSAIASGVYSGHTIVPSLLASQVKDSLGNLSSASTSSDNSVTYDNVKPAAATISATVSTAWNGTTSPAGSTTTSLTAKWTPSTAADLKEQRIQFYESEVATTGCTGTPLGSLTTLTKTAISQGTSSLSPPLTLKAGRYYRFLIRSIDNATNYEDACSPEMLIKAPAPTLTGISPTSGPIAGGTLVTLTGTNFVSGAVAKFGTVSCTTTFVSATSLTCLSPEGAAGDVLVKVVNPDGQESGTKTFKYLAMGWTTISATGAPTDRADHSAVWTGSKMIIWGGADGSSVYNDGAIYDPTTDSWTPTAASSLQGRTLHAAVWTGGKMIIWGGSNFSQGLSDGASYDPSTATWTALPSAGLAGRFSPAVVWTGSRMIIWGGAQWGTYGLYSKYADGAIYNSQTNAWTTMPAAPIAARHEASAIWTGSKMIIWGGCTASTCTKADDGAIYDLSSGWTMLPAAPLQARTRHSAVWTGGKMIIWGGDFFNDGASYDPSTNSWTMLPAAPLSARGGHSAVWTGGKMIVWGGYTQRVSNPYSVEDDGAIYDADTETWSALPASPLTARARHSAIWTGGTMIIFGGAGQVNIYGVSGFTQSGGALLDMVAVLAPTTWSAIPTGIGEAAARYEHVAVWTGSKMVIWGGSGRNDGAIFDPAANSWNPLPATTLTARAGATAVWTGSKIIIWGGCGGSTSLGTGAILDPAVSDSTAWTALPTGGGARWAHAAVWTGSKMIVWGGDSTCGSTNNQLDTGAAYDPESNSWTALPSSGLKARMYPNAVWTGSKMIVWGGVYAFGQWFSLGTGSAYDPASGSWTALPAFPFTIGSYMSADYGGKQRSTTIWTGSKMIVWGGSMGGGAPYYTEATGISYDPSLSGASAWSTLPAAPIAGRKDHTAVWTGSKMIIFGGRTNSATLSDGAFYDPSVSGTAAWTLLPSGTVARDRHTAVWTGSQMIVWGGAVNGTAVNTGAILK